MSHRTSASGSTAAVNRLDYRPNLAASNLRRTGARTGLIGALVQDLSNSFSASLLRALEDSARRRGTAVLAASLDEGADREQELVHDLVTRRVDGLVHHARERAPGLPRRASCARAPRRSSSTARRAGSMPTRSPSTTAAVARLAAEHLLAQGHRRIAALVDLETIPTAAAGSPGSPTPIAAARPAPRPAPRRDRAPVDRRGHRGDARPARPRRPTHGGVHRAGTSSPQGRFAPWPSGACGARSPSSGFDDFPLADLLDPPLTVIRQDVARIGKTVADLLFDRIDGNTSPPRHIVHEPTLVVRGSGEISPPG